MSSSPKYSDVQLSAEAARRQREENRRRAEERAAQRAAEAERRHKERLCQSQAAFKARLADGKKGLAAFAGTPASRHVADSLRQLQARLAQIEQKAPAGEEEIARAEKDLHRVRREFKQTIAQAKAAEDAHNLQEEAATVLRWKYQAAEDRQGSQQFDPDGLARFEAALREAAEQVDCGKLSGARRVMAAVGRLFEQHRAEVEKRRGPWLARKQASEAALARLQERIAGLQSDQVVQRWGTPAVADISERASQLSKIVENGQFEHAAREAEKLLAEADRILKAAEERQCRQQNQDYIVQSTVGALQECGFIVDAINQSPQDGNMDIVIQVHKLDGRGLTVSVPHEKGSLTWDPHGFARGIEQGSDGRPAAVCDEAVEEIEAVQERLGADYGVETCKLTWAGQDPNRSRKVTKKSGSHVRSQSSQRTRQARLR